MKNSTLEAVVFVCGASMMILELAGSRIMAPYVGTSIIVWTNLIGVVLAFLSLGYAWGGRMADRRPDVRAFSRVILGAGVWVLILGFIHDPVLILVQSAVRDIRIAALLSSLILFAVPSTLLGMVLPYAAKLKVHSLSQTGATVGGLYALSTVGSIAGTFLTGFVLLAYFKNTSILFVLSALLVLTSLAASRSAVILKVVLLASLTALTASSDALAEFIQGKNFVDTNTAYSRVWIFDRAGGKDKGIRLMQINDELSTVQYAGTHELYSPYTKFYRLCGHFYPGLKKTLMLGGAGYAYPKDFLGRFPEATMDVVEIDPGVTALARKYFGLKDNNRLTVYHEDARTYLNRNQKIYDVIFSDVFRSSSIPHHLTTEKVFRRIYDSLSDRGVLIANVIGSYEGDTGQFFRAEFRTIKKVFPRVYVFGVSDRDDARAVQNLMIVALKSPEVPKFYNLDIELNRYLQNIWINPVIEDMPVLTDDFAPVERYSIPVEKAMGRIENPILLYWMRVFGFNGKHRQQSQV